MGWDLFRYHLGKFMLESWQSPLSTRLEVRIIGWWRQSCTASRWDIPGYFHTCFGHCVSSFSVFLFFSLELLLHKTPQQNMLNSRCSNTELLATCRVGALSLQRLCKLCFLGPSRTSRPRILQGRTRAGKLSTVASWFYFLLFLPIDSIWRNFDTVQNKFRHEFI